MENSYRALMIAAGALLGIMLLTVFVYVFRAGASASKSVEAAKIEQELIRENGRFEVYNKDDNTVSEMVSLINLVYNYNRNRDYIEGDCMRLEIKVSDSLTYIIPEKDETADGGTFLGSQIRNKVLRKDSSGTHVVSVYELTTRNDLLGNGDLLSATNYDGDAVTVGTRTYKYLFKAVSYKYDLDSGHIGELKFEMYTVP